MQAKNERQAKPGWKERQPKENGQTRKPDLSDQEESESQKANSQKMTERGAKPAGQAPTPVMET